MTGGAKTAAATSQSAAEGWRFIKARAVLNGSLNAAHFNLAVGHAVRSLFGEVGSGAMPFELLEYSAEAARGVLRVRARDAPRVWASLTCMSEYARRPCRFEVQEVHDSLLSHADDLTGGDELT